MYTYITFIDKILNNAYTGPERSSRSKSSEFLDNLHMKVERLSVSPTHRLSIPLRDAAEKTMSMEKPNEAIGIQTLHLPACIAVHHPTVPHPNTHTHTHTHTYIYIYIHTVKPA